MNSQDYPVRYLTHLYQLVTETLQDSEKSKPFLIILALIASILGFAVRVMLLVLAGNQQVARFSGTGDQIRYLTLADSIFQGRGFTYAGEPTALRPPLYPLMLAIAHWAFGSHYPLAMRVIQFLIGIVVAYMCFLLTGRLFNFEAGAIAGAIALGLPTLILISTELQTEQFASLLTILFLFYVIEEIEGKKIAPIAMGIASGFAMLIRFNCALLPIIGSIVCLWSRRSLKNAFVVCFSSGLIITPWIIRNFETFHGQILYSSHGGFNLLEGVLTPDGRAQIGESERLIAAVGWSHTDIETNGSHRLMFASEDHLDRQASDAAIKAWKNLGWRSGLDLLATKVTTFWLSKDQLLDTKNFSPMQRYVRALGVIIYLIALVLALVGWLKLFSSNKMAASVILFYVTVITVGHLPFVMNTRLRVPFIDPLVAVLAAGGISYLTEIFQNRRMAKGDSKSPHLSRKTAVI